MVDLTGFYKEGNNAYKAKSKKKKPRRGKKKDTYPKRRKQVLEYFKLNEYATNAGICLCIHNETGWEVPGKSGQYPKFITRFSKKINRLAKVHGRKQHRYIKDFYNSKQWKELRYMALSLCEGKCQLCGASASDGVQLHVDHVKPRSKFPELQLDLDNIGVLCADCNLGKSNYDDFDYRSKL